MKNIEDTEIVVVKEDILFVVVPDEIKGYYGISYISSDEKRKIYKGQSVEIRLSSFQVEEYGFIRGKVDRIYTIPKDDGTFKIEIAFPNGLKSSTGYVFPYEPKMKGDAYISLPEQSILNHIIGSH